MRKAVIDENLIMSFRGEGSKLHKLSTNLFIKIIHSLVCNPRKRDRNRDIYLKSRKHKK